MPPIRYEPQHPPVVPHSHMCFDEDCVMTGTILNHYRRGRYRFCPLVTCDAHVFRVGVTLLDDPWYDYYLRLVPPLSISSDHAISLEVAFATLLGHL